MNEDDIIHSELSRVYEEEGISVKVEIFSGGDGKWILEVVDDIDTSHVTEELFESDEDAWNAFFNEVKAKGLDAYLSE